MNKLDFSDGQMIGESSEEAILIVLIKVGRRPTTGKELAPLGIDSITTSASILFPTYWCRATKGGDMLNDADALMAPKKTP